VDCGVGIIRRILTRPIQVHGELGYFGLGDWWLRTFSATERQTIEAAYQPPGLSRGDRPLTEGSRSPSWATAAGLLTALAGSLRKNPQDRSLAIQLLAKAQDRAIAENDVLGLHFAYQESIRLHYTWRDRFADAMDLAFAACYKQTKIASLAARAFADAYPGRSLPAHVGYEVMVVILEKQGQFAKALEVSKQAQSEGWPGNWASRIQRLASKSAACMTSISPSGLTPI
jgi:hypothetical protein